MIEPNPSTKHPLEGFPQVCFIKNTVTNPNIIIGDFTYYDDSDEMINQLEKLAWWDWSIEKITQKLEAITSNNIDALYD